MQKLVRAAVVALFFYLFPALTYAQPSPPAPGNFPGLLASSLNLLSEGRYSQAQKSLLKSLNLAKTPEDKKSVLFYLAETNASLGQLAQAAERYQQCLEIARKQGDVRMADYCQKSLEVLDLLNRAKNYQKDNKDDLAIDTMNKALEISESIKNETLKLKCLKRQATSFLNTHQTEKFFSTSLETNKIAKKLKISYEIIMSFNNIGHYHFSNNNINLAIDYFTQALSYINEDTLPEDVFDVFYNLGTAYAEIGNFTRAIEYFSQALEIISRTPENSYFAATLNNLGYAYAKKGLTTGSSDDFNWAFHYCNQAWEAVQKIGDKHLEVIFLNNLGSIKAHLEENYEAIYFLKKARTLAEELQLNSYLPFIYTNLGIIYARLGDYQNSTLFYDKAISLAVDQNENRSLWESYLEKANLLRKQGQLEQAKFYYLNSINIIEGLRSQLLIEEDKASFFGSDKRLDAYHNLIDMLVSDAVSNKKISESLLAQAFEYTERARARAFLESLEASRLSHQYPVDIRLANREKELMNELSRIYTGLLNPEIEEKERSKLLSQIKLLEEDLENVRRQIRAKNPAYATLTFPEIISLDRARKEFIDSQTVIITYQVGKESAYAFCLSSRGTEVYPIPAEKELKKIVTRHRRAISDTDNQDFSSGYELYRILVEPGLDSELKSRVKRLIIIPDDILTVLPFETLLVSEQTRDWLIKHFTVYYAPSISSLKGLAHFQNRKNRPKPAYNLLAVGDPYYGELEEKHSDLSTKTIFQDLYSLSDMKFYRLRYSDEEVRRISSLIPRTQVLTREKASEDLIKIMNLSDYRILHFAAHGLIDDRKPSRSSIVLTLDNDPAEDGFLQMREILNLKMNADLVVLSSCQTGLGQFIRGEGLEGLSRAFFHAGTSSVLISLWTINDQVAAQFMERFYLHLKALHKQAEALRAVKLEMIDSGVVSHPYYWAAFILNGYGDLKTFAPDYRTPLAVALPLFGLAVGALLFRRKILTRRENR
ncbi:MAG: CHAT domain-containing protein [Candidatus Saccharicenans sp.]